MSACRVCVCLRIEVCVGYGCVCVGVWRKCVSEIGVFA